MADTFAALRRVSELLAQAQSVAAYEARQASQQGAEDHAKCLQEIADGLCDLTHDSSIDWLVDSHDAREAEIAEAYLRTDPARNRMEAAE